MRQSILFPSGFFSPKVGLSRMRIFFVILLLGSFVLMLGVAFNYQNKKKQLRNKNISQLVEIHFWDMLPVPVLERNKIINQSLKGFDAFMRARSVSEKASATSDSLENVSRMTNFYHSNAMEVVPGRPSLESLAMMNVEGHDFFVLAVKFKGDARSSETWELVFSKNEEGEWMLDWPQFVRYQGTSWQKFVLGEGPDEGEFRLWVMRESALDSESEYCLKFYEPGKNGRSELGRACPNVMVQKDSKMGKEIYKMLRINELQDDVYRNAFSENPGKGLMRLRVVLAKEKDTKDQEWNYSIKKIIGEGWYGIPQK